MSLEQTIISSLSGIIGAVVGGFATYKTMAKQFKFIAEQEIQKQKRDDEVYLKRKREEVYLEVLDLFYLVNEEGKAGNQLTDNIKNVIWEKHQRTWGKINIWATDDVKKLFNEATNTYDSTKLCACIRKELGIKD